MVTSLIKTAESHKITGASVDIGVKVRMGFVGEGTLVAVCKGVEYIAIALAVCAAAVLASASNVAACGVLFTVEGRLHANIASNKPVNI